MNESGNGWSAPVRLSTLPRFDDVVTVDVVDLLGRGTACLVWSSPWPRDAGSPLRYVDLLSAGKPHLLTAVRNNLGGETSIEYAPSTEFYLADRAAGRPWLTRLPFVVHVVRAARFRDLVTGHSVVNLYTYHDGYFDPAEREFRGFGRVDQVDTESDQQPLSQPPVETRTWFHTGYADPGGVLAARLAAEYYRGSLPDHDLPGIVVPAGLTDDEFREAFRWSRGNGYGRRCSHGTAARRPTCRTRSLRAPGPCSRFSGRPVTDTGRSSSSAPRLSATSSSGMPPTRGSPRALCWRPTSWVR